MKNIDYDDYDPLLDVAANGYTPSERAIDVASNLIMGAPSSLSKLKYVGIIDTATGENGDIVVETSTGNTYFHNGECWVRIELRIGC